MSIDIEALARNQKKLIEVFETLNKKVGQQAKAIEKLHERVKYLESKDPQMATNDLMQAIMRGKK